MERLAQISAQQEEEGVGGKLVECVQNYYREDIIPSPKRLVSNDPCLAG